MKIGFFITARLKSSRLKRKILLDLNGRNVLERVIDRCKATEGIDGVVLCTSTNTQDAELKEYADNEGIQFFRGSEDDVLQRLLDAAQYYNYDSFLSITADNPLFSIDTSQVLVSRFRINPYDFAFTTGLPIGMATSMLETKALDVAVHMKKQSNTEIWGPFLNRSDFFNVFNLIINNSPINESKRLTIDYQEDYNLISTIYNHFNSKQTINFIQLAALLEVNSGLWKINEYRSQRWPTEKELNDINVTFVNNKIKGIVYAEKILKELRPTKTVEVIDYTK